VDMSRVESCFGKGMRVKSENGYLRNELERVLHHSNDTVCTCLQFIFGVADKHDPRVVLEEVRLCPACVHLLLVYMSKIHTSLQQQH